MKEGSPLLGCGGGSLATLGIVLAPVGAVLISGGSCARDLGTEMIETDTGSGTASVLGMGGELVGIVTLWGGAILLILAAAALLVGVMLLAWAFRPHQREGK